MRPVGIVSVDVVLYHCSELPGSLVLVYVDTLILQCPEKALCPCIVETLAFAVHRDPNAGTLDHFDVIWIGKMHALITVDDFRLVLSQRPFETA